nr:immunoglobulin light chain junction region [Macaca mulatta]MOX49326.1 immunoglobulin light chain junction region [Macaca mulatta]MOX49482.1 immunoglobulin light chain junction region [Macaca mulatta]MOX49523.1 immunoglobulin light chain junction region [Macaca mulatta]MOX49566.1 immunoglobulin light chain junction region [Macaca mulatta]
CHQYNNWNSF